MPDKEDALSQNQVENLLKAMETMEDGDGGGRPEPKFSSEQEPQNEVRPSRFRDRVEGSVTAYDFKRPERVGKEQMRSLQTLHESLARKFGASISGMLRTLVEVDLVSVDQLTYSEFIFGLDNPSCFTVMSIEPLEGNWVLDIAPSLCYAIIDRLLGGDPVPGDAIRRPLTEIETRLIGRVVDVFLTGLRSTWETIADLDLKIEKFESNPQLVQIVPPNEVVILIGFELQFGKNRGMFNLCIPFNTIEVHNQKLSRNNYVGYNKHPPSPQTKSAMTRNIHDAPLDVVVTLARSKVSTRDLLDLSIGDIVTTDTPVATALEVAIQDVPKFIARPGAFKGKKAIRVDGIHRD